MDPAGFERSSLRIPSLTSLDNTRLSTCLRFHIHILFCSLVIINNSNRPTNQQKALRKRCIVFYPQNLEAIFPKELSSQKIKWSNLIHYNFVNNSKLKHNWLMFCFIISFLEFAFFAVETNTIKNNKCLISNKLSNFLNSHSF